MLKSHVVTQPSLPRRLKTETGLFWVHQVLAAVDNLCWLIEYEEGKVALVDGPGADEVLAYLSKHNLRLTHVLNTHTHGDHIGVNRALEQAGLLADLEVWGSANAPTPIPGLTRAFHDGDRCQLGALNGWVMLTEGHLNGHISFVFGSDKSEKTFDVALFCGDTLFCGGCGYVFDGPMSVMASSLDRLAQLPPQTLVYCAHEYTLDNLHFALSIEADNLVLQQRALQVIQLRAEGRSTVPSSLELECATNPFLRSHSSTICQAVGAQIGETRAQIFEQTRSLKNTRIYKEIQIDVLLRDTV